jgi:HSP20 family protein
MSENNVKKMEKRPVFSPATDIYEDEKTIALLADMPGVKQENIDITLENDTLSITGEQCDCEPEGYKSLHQGYRAGVYKRSFSVLADIDSENISAKINNGVLKIVLPKSEKAQPRKIAVQTG